MKISQKAEYAVRAILDLTLNAPPNRGSRSSEVAGRTGVPGKFLDAILLDLRRAGFVASKRGPDGGHWLARDPSRVTVGAILESIDGPLTAPSRDARRKATPADVCLLNLWDRIAASVHTVVDAVTLEDLRRETASPGVADFTI